MFLWAPCITALDCFNPSLIWRLKKPYFIVKWELEKQLSLLYTTRIYAPAHFLLIEGHHLFSQKFASQKRNPSTVFPHKYVSWIANASSQGVFLRRVRQQLHLHSMIIRHRHSSLGTVRHTSPFPLTTRGWGCNHPCVLSGRGSKQERQDQEEHWAVKAN